MEDMNEYFENMRKSSAQLEKSFQEINREARQRLEEINQKMGNIVEKTSLEQKMEFSTIEAIQTNETEANIQSSVAALDRNEKENENDVRLVEEFKEIVSNVPSGTVLGIPEDAIKKSIEKSVKPKAKVKNKQKDREIDLEKAKKKVLKYVGAVVLTTGITATLVGNLADDVYASHLKNETLEEYTETVYEPNTKEEWVRTDGTNRLIDSHDFKNMIEETHQKYENPIVGFYMLYTKLDQECKNNYMNSIMASFNLHYGTDYKNLDDVLAKNNFKDYDELSKYVSFEIYRMHAKEESVYDESQSSTIGR